MVDTFCVECGTVGTTFGGLCQEDYVARHTLITPPQVLSLPECVHCQKLKAPGGWVVLPLAQAVAASLLSMTTREKAVTYVEFFPAIPETASRQRDVAVIATVRVEGFVVDREFTIILRTPGATCPECSRQRGNYYESILQLRTTSGLPDETLKKEVTAIVEGTMTQSSSDFITRIEKVRGGIDFYLSSNSSGKKIAKMLGEAYGAETKSAAKLYGQDMGKELYRVTYLVRVPVAGRRRR